MATLLKQKKFEFISRAMPEDTFGVVNFKGSEGFSTCYQFEITLVSTDPEIDLTAVLQYPATFTILRNDGDIPFHGILFQFDQLHAVDEFVFYKAVLAPKLLWLSLTHHNQIFLDKTIPQILAEVLQDGGLTTKDFELKLQNSYPTWEYICQYRESHLNFVSRWMEREGMYYYFEQTDAGEKMIITDTNLSHTPMAEGRIMYYSPPTGLDETRREEVIHSYTCSQKLLPGKLHIQDYNYRTPSVNLSAEAPVSDQGRGEVHVYGEHFRTLQEGASLANIRVQELLSHEKRFHGESTIPYLRPGYRFDLERHYRDSFNQPYLTIEMTHEGSQSGFLVSGVRQTLSETEERPYYRNTFVTIPANVQYRHPKQTPKPHFYGTIHARIDALGSGEYAQLDEQGRYKVILPFDLSGRKDGKASHWMRMAQPYAGENQGMHFPLHKHTEVLLTFIEGDPDRPIIAAAVPNPESKSPVNSSNQMKSFIKSGRGPQTSSVGASFITEAFNFLDDNFIELDDEENAERILIHSPGDIWLESNLGYGEYHHKKQLTQCEQPEALKDRPPEVKAMLDNFGDSYNPKGLQTYGKHSHFRVSNFDTFNTQEGNIYDFGGYWEYNLGNSYTENFMEQDSSVTLNADHPDDKAAQGGPTPGEITCQNIGNLNNSTWIEKTIEGAAYNYAYKTKTLEVEHETEEETYAYRKKSYSYTYGGRTEEKAWDGTENQKTLESWVERQKGKEEKWDVDTGNKVYTHEFEPGINKETTYCRNTGAMLTYSTSQRVNPVAIDTYDFCWANYSSASLTFAASASFDLNLAASVSINLDLAFALSLNLKLAGEVDFSFSAAASAQIGIGTAFDFKMYWNPSWELKLKNFKFELHGPGTKLTKEEALDAAVGDLLLADAKLQLQKDGIQLTKKDIKAEKGNLSLENSTFFYV